MALACASGVIPASAQEDRRIQELLPRLSNAFPLSQVLVDQENVVWYERQSSRLYHLGFEGGRASVKTEFALRAVQPPVRTERPPGSEPRRLYVADLSAERDGKGNIVVAWMNSFDWENSLRLLYLKRDGAPEHHVVKQFPGTEPFFDLRVFPLDSGAVQFFYTYFSERRASIRDVGAIQKIWTLLWRGGKVQFDAQLSEKGSEHAKHYDARYRGHGTFDMAWNEERIASILGPGRKLKIGAVSADASGPRLKESGNVALDTIARKQDLVRPIIVPLGNDDVQVVAEISYGEDGKVYKRVDRSGKVVGEVKLKGDISEFDYDPKTRLFRYVKGPLMGFLHPPKTIKAEVHWTDFDKQHWSQELDLPGDAIFLLQKAGDCFYWLQRDTGTLELHRKCRGKR